MNTDKLELVDPADSQAVARWAVALGTSPHAVRAVIPIVGRSSGALQRHFQGPLARLGTARPFFDRFPLAKELADLFSRLQSDPHRRDTLGEGIAPLLGRVLRAIQQGDIRLDYLPAEEDTVCLPAPGSDLFMQALLYWRIRLERPIPEILEAVAAAGPRPTVDVVSARLAEIEKSGRGAAG